MVGDEESVDDDEVDCVRWGRERFRMLATDSAGDEGGGVDLRVTVLNRR